MVKLFQEKWLCGRWFSGRSAVSQQTFFHRLIGSACAGCSGTGPVIPVAPIVPVAPLRGMYNLILSKANAETSLLARLCNARFVIYVHM